jgi:hypothetical protein
MAMFARSFATTSIDSLETGRDAARRVCGGFDGRPAVILTYVTVNHDQTAFLQGLRQVAGDDVAVVGCSTQGVVGQGLVREEGYVAGAMALGGRDVTFSTALIEGIGADPYESGRALGRSLKSGQNAPLRVVILHYDALSGADPERLIAGVYAEVECAIVGGAAAHSFNYQSLQQTFQYYGGRVLTGSAVAVGLSGAVGVEIDDCHGCSPVGVELAVTRADKNVIFELDGRSAAQVWAEICGDVTAKQNNSSALAIGVPVENARGDEYLVRAAYLIDLERGGIVLGPAIPEGTKIMLHHRTVEDVLEGARNMGNRLAQRLHGRPVRAVLGFECGARTSPFLGEQGAREENLSLQRQLGSDAAWLGMMPWGEVFPILGKPTFHNYSYPMLVLTD